MATNRNIALCIVFSIITCGIYGIYWFIKITDETNSLVSENQTASGGLAFLYSLLTCGIYTFYWAYKLGQKTDEINGNPNGSSSILFLVLNLLGLGIINYCIAQDAINKRC